MESTVER